MSEATLFGSQQGSDAQVVVLGLPMDAGSTAFQGTGKGPIVLRNLSFSLGLKQGYIFHSGKREKQLQGFSISDAGTLKYLHREGPFRFLQKAELAVAALAKNGKTPVVLGGDHLCTLPVVKGLCRAGLNFQVLHIDAHTDYHILSEGDLPTHANFVSFALQETNIEQWTQVGVRTLSRELPEASSKLVSATCEDLKQKLDPFLPVYLTVDSDAFDPSILPAVGHPVARGLQWADFDRILLALRELNLDLIGVDWVEYNPDLDSRNLLSAHSVLGGLGAILDFLHFQQRRKQ